MIRFNTKTGEIFSGEHVVTDAMVLSHLSEEVTLQSGTEDHLSLNSLRMMLTHYPALTQLSLRTKRFLRETNAAQAKTKQITRRTKPLDYLELRKVKSVHFNELTARAGIELFELDEECANAAFKIHYEDKPSQKVEFGVYLNGRKEKDERHLSLIGHSVAQMLHLPIRLENVQIQTIQFFANEQRDDLDYQRVTRESVYESTPDLTLMELIETVMIELTLC